MCISNFMQTSFVCLFVCVFVTVFSRCLFVLSVCTYMFVTEYVFCLFVGVCACACVRLSMPVCVSYHSTRGLCQNNLCPMTKT